MSEYMNIKISVDTLRKAGVLVIGFSPDDTINLNKLNDSDRKKYFYYMQKIDSEVEQ